MKTLSEIRAKLAVWESQSYYDRSDDWISADVPALIAALELAIEQRNKAMQGNWDKASIEEVGECIVEDDSALEAILKGSET